MKSGLWAAGKPHTHTHPNTSVNLAAATPEYKAIGRLFKSPFGEKRSHQREIMSQEPGVHFKKGKRLSLNPSAEIPGPTYGFQRVRLKQVLTYEGWSPPHQLDSPRKAGAVFSVLRICSPVESQTSCVVYLSGCFANTQ